MKTALDPRTLPNVRLRKQLDMLPEEYPTIVWLKGHGWVEVIHAVVNTIYVNGKPRPVVGLVTAEQDGDATG